MSSIWANLLTTLISSCITGAGGFYTARLMARVQQQAATNTASGAESERAWKRVDATEDDADHFRELWSKELEARTKAEARVIVLEGEIEKLRHQAP